MEQIKITLVDDHALFRNGLKILLGATPEIHVINEAANGKEFLEIIEHELPHIVLMDINMPVMDGVEATQEAMEKYPGLKIIALSMFGEEDYYYRMINAGVKGFLLKNSEINEVIEAIKQVNKGNSYFSQELLYNVIKSFKPHKEVETELANLSKRELQVLEEICKGLSNQEIADNLFISKRTVDKHRANLLSKTNSKNTANLIMYAIKNKLIAI
ncbi:MAG: DNA-binding response regulator [Bacteroidetes bacterium HGW-Bacteroidetes-4]|jgi:DNA-binding NarL/FixJ family response regulator|nr:MAG: DNA-binding response regulator [Bacteroidetes bacterium HGW-Bacteroidetes-4]